MHPRLTPVSAQVRGHRRPQPSGFHWFQVIPAGLEAEDVYAAVIDEQARSNSRFPADSASAVRRAIQALYRPGR